MIALAKRRTPAPDAAAWCTPDALGTSLKTKHQLGALTWHTHWPAQVVPQGHLAAAGRCISAGRHASAGWQRGRLRVDGLCEDQAARAVPAWARGQAAAGAAVAGGCSLKVNEAAGFAGLHWPGQEVQSSLSGVLPAWWQAGLVWQHYQVAASTQRRPCHANTSNVNGTPAMPSPRGLTRVHGEAHLPWEVSRTTLRRNTEWCRPSDATSSTPGGRGDDGR